MRIVTNWEDVMDIPDGEIFVSNLGGGDPAWTVGKACGGNIGMFFEKQDAIDYAEWIQGKTPDVSQDK